MIGKASSVKGCYSGVATDSEDTLRFCQLHHISPMNEIYPFEEAQAAYDRMISGKARFRVVLKMTWRKDRLMALTEKHWDDLVRRGYTVVSDLIDEKCLRSAQDAANRLNAVHPDCGWERSKNELWREIRHCPDPAFQALATTVLDPLALEILETAHSPERIQLASTLPGFETRGGIGRNFHIDGGKEPSLAAFNVLFGVALTTVASDRAGGFHVLPGSHENSRRRSSVSRWTRRCTGGRSSWVVSSSS